MPRAEQHAVHTRLFGGKAHVCMAAPAQHLAGILRAGVSVQEALLEHVELIPEKGLQQGLPVGEVLAQA